MNRGQSSLLLTLALLSITITLSTASNDASCGWSREDIRGRTPDPRDEGLFLTMDEETIVYGFGYPEVVALGYNDLSSQVFQNDLWVLNVTSNTWTELQPVGAVPPPRALGCWVYDPYTHAVYVSHGVQYPPDFSVFNFWTDGMWKYSFASNTWTNLSPANMPPGSGGMTCDIDPATGNIWWMGGAILNTTDGKRYPSNAVWRYNIAANNWFLEKAQAWPNCPHNGTAYTSCNAPFPRQQHEAHVLSDGTMLVVGGTAFSDPALSGDQLNIPLADVWIYKFSTKVWTQKPSLNTYPSSVIHEFVASVVLNGAESNDGIFYSIGGDAQGDKTQATECDPSAVCIFPVTPTNDIYKYDLKKNKWSVVDTNFNMPQLRKTHAAAVCDSDHPRKPEKACELRVTGGTNFWGFDGVGSYRYRDVYALRELDKY